MDIEEVSEEGKGGGGVEGKVRGSREERKREGN